MMVGAAAAMLIILAIEASGAYDVDHTLIEIGNTIHHYDHSNMHDTTPYLYWDSARDVVNVTVSDTPAKYGRDGPWIIIERTQFEHPYDVRINGERVSTQSRDHVGFKELTLFEYLRSEIKSLNQTIRLQASHIQVLHDLNLELSQQVDAMNKTLQKRQGIAPLN